MQLAHPRHIDIYVQNSKHKIQNTEVISYRTQNICTQHTMSHIGFRRKYLIILLRILSTNYKIYSEREKIKIINKEID